MESILKYIIEKLAPTPEESKKMAGKGRLIMHYIIAWVDSSLTGKVKLLSNV